jgi:peptide/nickel transport system substrate-binding protein
MLRALAALVVAALLASANLRASAADETLHLAINSDPHSLTPFLRTTTDEANVEGLVFDSLVDYDGANRVHPTLIAEIPTRANGGISADGKTVTLHLRRNVKWHDGVPFNATDVVYTINAILDPKNNVANRALYTHVAAVTAFDPYTVRFRLNAPQASFLATVGYAYPIVPEHLLAKSADLKTDPFNGQPVGTGPYRFVRWARGEHLEFEANPDYFAGPPKIGRVSVAIVPDFNTEAVLLRQHALDFAALESSIYNQLRDAPGLAHKLEPLNDFVAVAMNAHRPLLHDRRVRAAIVRAVDRNRIARTATFGTGTPAYADLPLFMYDGHPPAGWNAYDPAGATALLDAAGWKPDRNGIREKDGVPLRLEVISFSGSPTATSVALQIQQMLRRVGVDTSFKPYAPSLYYSPASAGGPVMAGHYDLAFFSFTNGTDPSNDELYACASRIPAGFNTANYCSPEMERLQAASEREYGPVKRNKIVAAIEALAVRDATYVFLYHTPYRLILNPALRRPTSGLTNEWYAVPSWTFATP